MKSRLFLTAAVMALSSFPARSEEAGALTEAGDRN